MRKLSVIIILISFVGASIGADNHTQNNLYLLGIKWGDYKYSYSSRTEKFIDWDKTLIEIIENENLLMLDSGKFLNYIDSIFFDKINLVKAKKNNSSSFYSKNNFENELQYNTTSYPNIAYRYLSLFRYWNAVKYFYSYSREFDNWDEILVKYIPIFKNASNSLEYNLSVCSLVAELQDSHCRTRSTTLDEYFGYYQMPPIKIKYIQNQYIVSKVLSKALVKIVEVGDTILKLNNLSITQNTENIKKFFSGSNDASTYYDISMYLLAGDSKDSINILFGTKEGRKNLVLAKNIQQQDYYPSRYNYSDTVLFTNIQYVDLETIDKKRLKKIINKFDYMDGLIIDLRGRPQNYGVEILLTNALCKSKKETSIIKWRNPKNIYTMKSSTNYINPKQNKIINKSTVLLVDESTISYGETCVMDFLQCESVKIFGSHTRGANGGVASLCLPGGLVTYFTIEEVYYPNGKLFTKEGILPDIYVPETIKGVQNGKDEVLEKAIEFITKQ